MIDDWVVCRNKRKSNIVAITRESFGKSPQGLSTNNFACPMRLRNRSPRRRARVTPARSSVLRADLLVGVRTYLHARRHPRLLLTPSRDRRNVAEDSRIQRETQSRVIRTLLRFLKTSLSSNEINCQFTKLSIKRTPCL
ncbi:hypothetical protein PUN28_009494 [Cardiocondyla obscurior]|uniref:Uncharacterized protein n=1 Tax=Cardiocondyla obscurior TaxID=286306 RepID=A0AAW2FUM2_9HYME